MSTYPSRFDYVDAVRNYETTIKVDKLRDGRPIKINGGWQLEAYSGNFAQVFPIQTTSKKYGLRCFLVKPENVKERYERLQKHIDSSTPYIAEFGYVDNGIIVKGEPYPVSFIDWIDGEELNTFIDRNINDSTLINQTAGMFSKLVADLHEKQISHGDLQHGNILVCQDGSDISLKLIDYDTVSVPGGSLGLQTTGLAAYQHPLRTAGRTPKDHIKIDNFSELVIYLSLRVYAEKPSLRTANIPRLLFEPADYDDLTNSEIFGYLMGLSPDVQNLTKWLELFCREKDINQLVPLAYCLENTPPTKDPFMEFFGSQTSVQEPPSSNTAKVLWDSGFSDSAVPTAPSVNEAKRPTESAQRAKSQRDKEFSASSKTVSASASSIGRPKSTKSKTRQDSTRADWDELFKQPSPPSKVAHPSSAPSSSQIATSTAPPTTRVGLSISMVALFIVLCLFGLFVITGTTGSFEVSATSGTYNTNLFIEEGSIVCVLPTGSWTVDQFNHNEVGPQGYDETIDANLTSVAPGCKSVNEFPFGALVAQIGGQYYLFDNIRCVSAISPGTLTFTINDDCLNDNNGIMNVSVFTHKVLGSIRAGEQ